jgi:hypothetical protein
LTIEVHRVLDLLRCETTGTPLGAGAVKNGVDGVAMDLKVAAEVMDFSAAL